MPISVRVPLDYSVCLLHDDSIRTLERRVSRPGRTGETRRAAAELDTLK